MKKIFLSLLALSAMTGASVKAQRVCGSADHYQEMLHTDPLFKHNHDQIELQTQYYQAHPEAKVRALKTIPVVVHVVYNTATQNVSDAQILSQIDVLNKDFRKLNTDWSNTPLAFQALVADCEVEFCLAKQDPNGNPSTGIVRKSTTVTSFGTNDAVKKNAQGGDDAWNASKYLNLWVCNLSGGVLGYAQFPGGPAATDGVVITHTGFGTTGTAAAPFNKGRTATHEVGHWLNLYHIWGDDGAGCSGSDLVGDTPNQADENYGCPSFPAVSCSNGPNGDMFMNYMDYTDDACMFMFSAGQKARMDALFATGGSKASLLTSLGCTVPNPTACGTPSGLSAGSITTSGATITWGAVTGASSYNVQYKLASASIWTNTTSSTTSKALTGLSASSVYNVQVQAVCTSGSSAYSSILSFTTSGAPTCSNNYEANNTRNTATSISLNTSVTSMIGTSSDKDYFKIVTLSSAPKLKVTLGTLPFDYDLKLYNSAGSLLATSQNGSTLSETITYNSASTGATYYIYVYGYGGAYSNTQCYTLSTQTSATNLKLEQAEITESKASITIYPSPASNKINVEFFAASNQEVILNLYSPLGQKLNSQRIPTTDGLNTASFDVANFSNGIYILEMIDNEEKKTQKFVIQK